MTARKNPPAKNVENGKRSSLLKRSLAILGPGLITGAADDDPSGISTYSVAGAAYGYATLWIALLTFPLMVAIQLMCARLGMVTGRGLATAVRTHYPRWVLWGSCSILVVANIINIGEDLGGMVGVHQFVRIGAHSMCGGGSTLVQDVPPFVLCRGSPAQPFGINVEGLQRRGYDEATIAALKRAYRSIFREGLTLAQAREAIQSGVESGSSAAGALAQLTEFLAVPGRGIIR